MKKKIDLLLVEGKVVKAGNYDDVARRTKMGKKGFDKQFMLQFRNALGHEGIRLYNISTIIETWASMFNPVDFNIDDQTFDFAQDCFGKVENSEDLEIVWKDARALVVTEKSEFNRVGIFPAILALVNPDTGEILLNNWNNFICGYVSNPKMEDKLSLEDYLERNYRMTKEEFIEEIKKMFTKYNSKNKGQKLNLQKK